MKKYKTAGVAVVLMIAAIILVSLITPSKSEDQAAASVFRWGRVICVDGTSQRIFVWGGLCSPLRAKARAFCVNHGGISSFICYSGLFEFE